MRIAIISALIFFTCGQMISQTEAGRFMISAELGGFDSGKYYKKTGDSAWVYDYNRFNLMVSPKGGYFFANGFVMGVEINYGIDRYKFSNDVEFTTEIIGVIPFARVYLLKKSISPFIEAGAGIYNEVLNTNSAYSSGFDTKYPGRTANAGIGVSYFATEKAALDCRIGYGYMKTTRLNSNPETSNKYGKIFMRVGATFFIKRK